MRSVESFSVIIVLNLFFVFSRFFWFLTKSIKNLEKTKKNKIADPNSPACTMGLAILFFLVFSRFLILLVKNQKNLEKTKKPKKPKLQDPWYKLVS